MSEAQTTAAVTGSIASFFDRRTQTTPVPPGSEAFTAGPVDILGAASAAAVTTAEPFVCGELEYENQPNIAEPGQTTVL